MVGDYLQWTGLMGGSIWLTGRTNEGSCTSTIRDFLATRNKFSISRVSNPGTVIPFVLHLVWGIISMWSKRREL